MRCHLHIRGGVGGETQRGAAPRCGTPEVRRLAERMITLGKRGDLHARRRALRVIRRREVAAKVFDELAKRYEKREGGYTRVLKTRQRVGDGAAMSVVELVDSAEAMAATSESAD